MNIRFDDFNKKAIEVLNSIIKESNCDIVVSSDWRLSCTLEEMGEYYLSQGIIKKPIDFTKKLSFSEETWKAYEKNRVFEINEWIKDHPQVTHWVAVDDLNLSELSNFVHTKIKNEGIKQSGIKEKILQYFKGENG